MSDARGAAPPTVCILAGGLGRRLGDHVRTVPKPLVEVAGRPFITHQLDLLNAQGIRRVVLCVGYLGELIERRIGPRFEEIELAYSYDGPGLDGTLGAIRRARQLLGEQFLILYADTYLRIDYCAVAECWHASGQPALMTVLRNEGRWDSSNAVFEGDRVRRYDKRNPTSNMHWIDYGLGGLRASALGVVPSREGDLSELYRRLAQRGELFGLEATERFYEIGTPASLAETDAFLRRPGVIVR